MVSFQNWVSARSACESAVVLGASEKKIPPKPLEVRARLCVNQVISSCKRLATGAAPAAGVGKIISLPACDSCTPGLGLASLAIAGLSAATERSALGGSV